MKIRTLLISGSVLIVIAYVIWVLFFPYDPALENTFFSLGVTALHIILTIFSLSLVRQKSIDFRIRRGWLFIGLATFCNIAGIVLYFYIYTLIKVDPFPSIGDIFYLFFYPLTLAGVISFPHKPFKRMDRLIFLFDLSIVMITVIMIFWYFILAPMHLSSKGGWEGMVAIAYPIGDLLLFAASVILILRKTEKISGWTSLFIVSSILITAVPDYYYCYYKVNNIPYSLTKLNIWWIISALFMLVAVHNQLNTGSRTIPDSIVSDRSKRLLSVFLPYLAAVTGPVLLVIVINSSIGTTLQLQGLLYGTIILTILVLGRQQLLLIDNKRLYEEIRKLAITDSLTNVHNRHHFNEIFQQEIERARRYNHMFSILLLDVDNFKSINDTYGHLQGDKVLKIIAGLLSEQVRKTDFLARFGGDEFVIILLETSRDDAQHVAQKIETVIGAHSYEGTPLRLSIGIACYKSGHSAEQLLEEADRQLYKNKIAKNQSQRLSAGNLIL